MPVKHWRWHLLVDEPGDTLGGQLRLFDPVEISAQLRHSAHTNYPILRCFFAPPQNAKLLAKFKSLLARRLRVRTIAERGNLLDKAIGLAIANGNVAIRPILKIFP